MRRAARWLLVALLASACSSTRSSRDGGTTPAADLAVAGNADLRMSGGGSGGSGGGGADMPAAPSPDLAPPPTLHVYVGGYVAHLAHYRLEPTGTLTPLDTTPAAGTPSFLAVDPARRHVYAVDEQNSTVESFSIDAQSGTLTHIGSDVSSGGNGPAHLSVDGSGKWILVANYGDGAIAILPIQADGSAGAATTVNHDCSAKAHQFVTDASNRFAFVACLQDNVVRQYLFDATKGTLTANSPATTATNVGITAPRHLAFRPGGAFAYVIEETDSTLNAMALDGSGRLTLLQRLSTLPPASGTSNGAEVQVHPSGKFVYGSNRPTSGNGTIVAFALGSDGKMSPLGFAATGQTPRHFSLAGSGRWLLVADQGLTAGSGDLRVFAVDGQKGTLTPVGTPLATPSPSFIGIVPLP